MKSFPFEIKKMSEKYRIPLVNAVSEFAVFVILYENRKSFRTFLISKNIETF
jgi:hypothetical protein